MGQDHLQRSASVPRETDTFDTFMESSWYYARYCSPTIRTACSIRKRANHWLPVDQYIGGIEHACMHLLYARFFHKLLRDAGLVKSDEPFTRLLCQGMVLADVDSAALSPLQKEIRRKTHETIRKVSEGYQRRYAFNTAIAAVMELCNELARIPDRSPQSLAVEREALEAAVLMLSPIAPHIAHALWQALGHNRAVIDEQWPIWDETALSRSSCEVVIQINGKLRAKAEVSIGCTEAQMVELARGHGNVQQHLEGKEIRKVIWVPDKLLNIVAG
jgi:leucyl-tRNA synthetase